MTVAAGALAPWFDPIAADFLAVRDDAEHGRWECAIGRLNRIAEQRALRNANARPIVFAAPDAAAGAPYEQHIWRSGEVPTRRGERGGWHDLFNALVWLAFPAVKAQLNRLQAETIAAHGVGPSRGELRDAATLFDESGAIVVTRDAELGVALREMRWRDLFVAARTRFAADVRVIVFGHALLDKLRAPYKAACAQAWLIDWQAHDALPQAHELDAFLAGQLHAGALRTPAFAPLPVLGVPGWWTANEDAAFYDDAVVFRPARGGVSEKSEGRWTS